MSFRKEPAYTHGTLPKTAVLLVNLGTPDAPTPSAVRRYLQQFLSDPRVVEIPRLLWWVILHGIILPFRARRSAKKYALIWTSAGSPLKVYTAQQATMLQALFEAQDRVHGQADTIVAFAMRYGKPSVSHVLSQLKEQGCERILILPAYPQYSATTTASIFDAVFAHYATVRNVPELRLIKHYHEHSAYIEALRQSVQSHWNTHGRADKLLMSFHGVPKRTLVLGDPYYCECHKTARLLAQALGLSESEYIVTFQSRFGKAEWLRPYTAPTLIEMAQHGIQRVDVICPGFTSDCLETLEEIAIEARREFLHAGGQEFHFIACLNDSPAWGRAMLSIVQQHMAGWVAGADAELVPEEPLAAQESALRARRFGAGQ